MYGAKLLEASGITKKFGDLVAVSGVDIRVSAGECLALLGPNGAGKTTTCEILEGLIQPDSGRIAIDGNTYKGGRRKIQEIIGVQLQDTNLYKKYTVRETFELFASFYKKSLDVAQLIADLGLDEKTKTRLEHLSGGQKQRVYLGCAMINDPKFLFLDEPTTGLDPGLRREIWNIVETLKSNNRGVLLTTHYMEEAEVLADRVAIIDRGSIICEGSPEELIKEIGGNEVIRLVARKSDQKPEERDHSQIQGLLAKTLAPFQEAFVGEAFIEIAVEDAGNFLPTLVREADSAGIAIDSLEMRRATLEDVFLKLTGRSIRDD